MAFCHRRQRVDGQGRASLGFRRGGAGECPPWVCTGLAMRSALARLPFAARLSLSSRKWCACGKSGFAASATGSAKPLFPTSHARRSHNPVFTGRMQHLKRKKEQPPVGGCSFFWLREPDLNRRPPGYEFREVLPISKMSVFVDCLPSIYTEISLFPSSNRSLSQKSIAFFPSHTSIFSVFYVV